MDEYEKLKRDAGLQHMPTPLTYDLRKGVSGHNAGEFLSWGYQWKDKPHRLVFAACSEVERQAERIATLEKDAARYRWLTESESIYDEFIEVWESWDGFDGKDGFDAVIDAAIGKG